MTGTRIHPTLSKGVNLQEIPPEKFLVHIYLKKLCLDQVVVVQQEDGTPSHEKCSEQRTQDVLGDLFQLSYLAP